MKFCTNCGNELREGADICLHCGKFIVRQTPRKQENKNTARTLGILALCLWIIPVAGWSLGAVGLSKAKTKGTKAMNIIGIILATAMFVLNLAIAISNF